LKEKGNEGMSLNMRTFNPKAYALRLLEIRGRSVREVRDKLKARSAAPQDVESVVAELLSLGLLDDEKFAREWIDSRRRLKPMGPARIRAELARKGIARETIAQAMEGYLRDSDQTSLALDLARRKMKNWRGLEREKIIGRMTGYLARRGFSGQSINQVVKKLMKENVDFE
jgi:regulatory protein